MGIFPSPFMDFSAGLRYNESHAPGMPGSPCVEVPVMAICQIFMLPQEHWYGACVTDGTVMPLTAASQYHRNLDPNPTSNQAASLLLSDKGRYLYCPQGVQLDVENGAIRMESTQGDIDYGRGYTTLRGAYQAASRCHFPATGQTPPVLFFASPQYNTWIELLYNQNQEGILRYAQGILDQGLPAGILMVDDGWNPYYGCWEFSRRAFPDPKEMVDTLHDMGFRVMLWTCPFISPDSREYRLLAQKGYLVRDREGEPAVRTWWNGHSAILDMTNPGAQAWYHQQNRALMDRYGIDGFKFDAGDGGFYRNDDRTYVSTDANGQTQAWMDIGTHYPYNEFRAGFGRGGLPLVHRLADKNHSWGENGVASLIPHALCQGILGYAFVCPDMIGGGEYQSFTAHAKHLDAELFVRYAQCAALMPMMQFSAAPWRVLPDAYARLCVEAAQLHEKMAGRIYALAQDAAQTGEPIVRYMEYQFPGEGLAEVTDQFMLGPDILVAPVLEKGARSRRVHLPKGRWLLAGETPYQGGTTPEVDAPLEVLPYFIREKEA